MKFNSLHFIKSIIIAMILLSCENKKTLNNYDLNNFYEIQGIVYEVEEVDHFFSESTWNAKYLFKVNEKSYKGAQKGFNIPMIIGQPVIILVHEDNPEINFYSSIGIIED